MPLWCILGWIASLAGVKAFSISPPIRHSIGRLHRGRTRPGLCMSERDDQSVDEDDEVQQHAYGNRSLNWTNKYRNVIPYEKARQAVLALGLRSKVDWDEYIEDGKCCHGPYLPNHPDQMYEHEWVSWDEFLGLMRPYEETRHIVQNVLCLKDMRAYELFVAADTKRAEGLRIPAKPEIVYRQKGWEGSEHFFGTGK